MPTLTRTRKQEKLHRTLARRVIYAFGIAAVLVGGLTFIDDAPAGYEGDRALGLAIGIGLVALIAFVVPRSEKWSDVAILRGTIIFMVAAAIVLTYATLAANGTLPAAPWSPIG